MAKIEWVEQHLENWARWSAERADGALGFPRASAFTRAPGAPRHAESRNSIPVNGLDAATTERAVQALRFVKGSLHAVVIQHYIHDLDGATLGQLMGGIGPRRAYQLVEEAHFELAKWFAMHRGVAQVGAVHLRATNTAPRSNPFYSLEDCRRIVPDHDST